MFHKSQTNKTNKLAKAKRNDLTTGAAETKSTATSAFDVAVAAFFTNPR